MANLVEDKESMGKRGSSRNATVLASNSWAENKLVTGSARSALFLLLPARRARLWRSHRFR
uniref:Uncharacterized protein n=1 Tax=Nelumbo nucifera TaxID=4432 RepID=A0A822Y3N7_NELNU|nr:TPA_asm: hypothetical protein HUJ06_027377 [Nelumbo nucifera]